MVAALLAVLGLFAAGALSIKARAKEQTALSAETARLAVTTVSAGYPQPEPRSNELELPGSVQAYTESPIYARTNGYLLRWYKDIGANVQKGELLADLDTPEVDQELSQAQAARQQMVAALDLARTSADRWRELRRTDSVSQQELDQRTSDYAQAQANMAAADANVRRLQELESFKHVYAPFAGVLTRRNVDIGALVNAGNGGSGKELFNLALIDPLRVYVSVPEADAPKHARGHAGLDRAGRISGFALRRNRRADSQCHRPEHAHAAHRGGCAEQSRAAFCRALTRKSTSTCR